MEELKQCRLVYSHNGKAYDRLYDSREQAKKVREVLVRKFKSLKVYIVAYGGTSQ